MEEILQPIVEAEEKAAGIKVEAQKKAAEIAVAAEAEAEKIAQKCESDCRLFRETQIVKAEKDAKENYEKSLEKTREKAKAYADGVLLKTDGTVNEIVRRITRGSC